MQGGRILICFQDLIVPSCCSSGSVVCPTGWRGGEGRDKDAACAATPAALITTPEPPLQILDLPMETEKGNKKTSGKNLGLPGLTTRRKECFKYKRNKKNPSNGVGPLLGRDGKM